MTHPNNNGSFFRSVRGSIVGICLLVLWDAVLNGSFCCSILVCPPWFLISILKNAIQRPGWGVGLARVAIPVVTLAVVLANSNVQYRIAEANAARIVTACEQFHRKTGIWPETLEELVPGYLPSVPRAKYCLAFGEFMYWHVDGASYLEWCAVPPFGRWVYSSEDHQWNFID